MGADSTHFNAHMKEENSYDGVRIGVMIAGEDFYIKNGINWGNIMGQVTPYEYGNTRFPEHVIVPFYFKHGFAVRAAGVDLGYSKKGGAASSAMQFRLRRMNPRSFVSLARGLFKAGMITQEDIASILNAPFTKPLRKRKGQGIGGGTPAYEGAVYRFYAKELVMSAVAKWGRRTGAKKLGIKRDVLKYWMGEKVEDIRVQPKSSLRSK